MKNWTETLKTELDIEFEARPRIGSLATVDTENRPRNRSVVIRRINPDGALWICGDTRADKASQVRQNPFAELVFWLPNQREQFRIAGNVEVGDDPQRADLWGELSDPAKAMFFWPAPGESRDPVEANSAGTAPPRAAMPENFDVMILRPDRVEQLVLSDHPHQRTRWSGPNWQEEEINP